MNEFTSTTNADPTSLTPEKILEARKSLEASLPELVYQTSENVPIVNENNESVFFVVPQSSDFLGGWGFASVSYELVLLHPDNLPELQKGVAGKYRLVPLQDKATEQPYE